MKIIHYNRKENNQKISVEFLGKKQAEEVRNFHRSFPMYEETPLVSLSNLAKELGVKDILVKDEAKRFELNAFKALGGSYAIGKYMASKLGKDISQLPYDVMISDEIRKELGDITFVSATDGNHGRGVAWTAKQLKQNCVIYLPKGSAVERLENIKAEGSEAYITELNYDDAVRLANDSAEQKGWVIIQDTAWEGYEEIPIWIMQGYTTLALEMIEQLGDKKPTHVFGQAGVGSFASAVLGLLADAYGEDRPIYTVVEPEKADCIFRSAEAGKRVFVTDDMQTIMAGLACGEPNTVSWEILKDYGDNYISAEEYVAAQGMRILANPLAGDERIISGESGASAFGAITEIIRNEKMSRLKKILEIDENSVLLFINTEGDTDKAGYREIVWDGAYARGNK